MLWCLSGIWWSVAVPVERLVEWWSCMWLRILLCVFGQMLCIGRD